LKRPEIRRRKSALKGRGFGDAWGNHRLDFNRAIPELISIIIAVVATAAVAASSSALVASWRRRPSKETGASEPPQLPHAPAETAPQYASGFGHRFSTAVARLTMNTLVKHNADDLWLVDQNMLYHVWLLARTDSWNLQIVDFEPQLPGQILFKQQFTSPL
jgi:hypothetical protein